MQVWRLRGLDEGSEDHFVLSEADIEYQDSIVLGRFISEEELEGAEPVTHKTKARPRM